MLLTSVTLKHLFKQKSSMVVHQTKNRESFNYGIKNMGLGERFKSYPYALVLYSAKGDHSFGLFWELKIMYVNFSVKNDRGFHIDIIMYCYCNFYFCLLIALNNLHGSKPKKYENHPSICASSVSSSFQPSQETTVLGVCCILPWYLSAVQGNKIPMPCFLLLHKR